MRILIVDDAPLLRTSLAAILRALGHAIAGEAATAPEASALARELVPDAIVVDGRLGGADVVALLADLKAVAPQADLFVVAAPTEIALVRAAVAGGAAGTFRRPFSAQQINGRLQGPS